MNYERKAVGQTLNTLGGWGEPPFGRLSSWRVWNGAAAAWRVEGGAWKGRARDSKRLGVCVCVFLTA